ncbi:MAG: 5-(carboxyamino)imidazole ribonucleotide synthase [Bacteroidota bacterium]
MSDSISLKANTVIGFLGAGQLARMSALKAFELGIQVASYSDRSEREPLEWMTPVQTTADFDNVDAMVKFAQECDVITLENEFIPSKILFEVRERSGTPIYPSPETFAKIENKLIEKQTFEAAGLPVTPYALIEGEADMKSFGSEHDWPYVLKSSKGGYDGYGNETVNNLEEAKQAYDQLGGNAGQDIIAEAFVDYQVELAVQVARNEHGIEVYECCETVQEKHINTAVIVPARIDDYLRKKAQEMAEQAVEAIDGKGIFAFEFFLTQDGKLLLNESAPRPHNSGHYSIEGAIASQFENHVRAVLDLPLGSAQLRRPASVMINLLGTKKREAQMDHLENGLRTPDSHLHIYGKAQSKLGRKMGHFTFLGEDPDELFEQATAMTKNIEI